MRTAATLLFLAGALAGTPASASVTTHIIPTSCQIEMAGRAIPCRNAAMTMLDNGDVVIGVGSGSTVLMFIGGKPSQMSSQQFSVPLRRVRLPNNKGALASTGVCVLKMVGEAVGIVCDANAEGGPIKLHLMGEGE